MIAAYEYTKDLEGIPIGNEIWWDVYNNAFNYYCRINKQIQKIINERR